MSDRREEIRKDLKATMYSAYKVVEEKDPKAIFIVIGARP